MDIFVETPQFKLTYYLGMYFVTKPKYFQIQFAYRSKYLLIIKMFPEGKQEINWHCNSTEMGF